MLRKIAASLWHLILLVLFGFGFAIFTLLTGDAAPHTRPFIVAWVLGAASPYIFYFPYAEFAGTHPAARALRFVQLLIRFLISAGAGLLWGILAVAPIVLAFPHSGRLPIICAFIVPELFWLVYIGTHWGEVTDWFEGRRTSKRGQQEDPLTPIYRNRFP